MNEEFFADMLKWLQGGAKLQTTVAVGILTGLVRYACVPGIKAVARRLGYDLSGTSLLIAVYGVSGLLTEAVNLLTHQSLDLATIAAMSYGVGTAAVGLHAAGKTVKDGSTNGV